MTFSLMILMRMFSAKCLLKMKVVQFFMLIFDIVATMVKQKLVLWSLMTKWLLWPMRMERLLSLLSSKDVVEVVVVATLVVDDLYDVVRDDVLKDLVRADVDQVVVVDVLSVMALSDADLDVSHLVDLVVNSLSLTFVDDPLVVVLFDADLDVSHLVDVVVAYLYVVVVVVYLLVVELYLFVVD